MMSQLRDTYSNKRVLITGHTGFKGQWLKRVLSHLGAEVVGISKDSPLGPRGVPVESNIRDKSDLRGDIRNFEDLLRKVTDFRPDFLFHLAAQAIVSRSYQDPLETISTNVVGTSNVLESVRRLETRCTTVVITSDKVYRNNEWLWGYRETDQLGGHDPYSASKSAAEMAISTYAESLFSDAPSRLAVARAGNVIGGGDWSPDRIVPDCARSWMKGTPVQLRSRNAVRPWQHVLEPLRGYLLLGRKLEADSSLHGEAFNFGPRTEDCRTVEELVGVLKNAWIGFSYVVDEKTSIGREATLLKLNCEKASQVLDWRPVLNFEQSVNLTADWYREFHKSGGHDDPVDEQLTQYFSFCGEKS